MRYMGFKYKPIIIENVNVKDRTEDEILIAIIRDGYTETARRYKELTNKPKSDDCVLCEPVNNKMLCNKYLSVSLLTNQEHIELNESDCYFDFKKRIVKRSKNDKKYIRMAIKYLMVKNKEKISESQAKEVKRNKAILLEMKMKNMTIPGVDSIIEYDDVKEDWVIRVKSYNKQYSSLTLKQLFNWIRDDLPFVSSVLSNHKEEEEKINE